MQLKVHACLPLLEQLSVAGLLHLPEKRVHGPYRAAHLRAEPLPVVEIAATLAEVRPVTVEPVPAEEQAVWDATMAMHHAMGFQRAFGAHQRYWIRGEVAGRRVILGGFLFGAPARSVALLDAWLGWTPLERQRLRWHLHHVAGL